MKKLILLSAVSLFKILLFNGSLTAQNWGWAKSMTGTGNNSDGASSIAVDAMGNVHTTGLFQSTVDFDPGIGTHNLTSSGNYDMYVSKLNDSGNFVWAKKIGGSYTEKGNSLALDKSGNIYLTGFFSGTTDFDPGVGTYTLTATGGPSGGGYDIFICKLDSSGNFVWAKRMGGAPGADNRGTAISVDESGHLCIMGFLQGTVDFDPGIGTLNLTSAGSYDIFVSKLDTAGNLVWAKRMGGASWDTGLSICTDPSGNIYTTGGFEGTADFDPGIGTFNLSLTNNYRCGFISKLDSAGNFIWAKKTGGTNTYEDLVNCYLALDAEGNMYSAGFFTGSADFDPGIGTFTLSTSGLFDHNIYVSKLDSAGNFIWAKQAGGATNDKGYSIALDSMANVYATGEFSGTGDFDPGLNTFNLSSAGSADIFILKLDSAGNFIGAQSMGGTLSDQCYIINADASGNIYTTGSFNGTADFDPGSGIFNLNSGGGSDIFVSKLTSASTTGLSEVNKSQPINIYPNPNSGNFTIEVKERSSITLFNILGDAVLSEINIMGKKDIDISPLPSGLYMLMSKNEDNINHITKIIKK